MQSLNLSEKQISDDRFTFGTSLEGESDDHLWQSLEADY